MSKHTHLEFLNHDRRASAVAGREVKNRFQLRYLLDENRQNGEPPSVEIHADGRVDAHEVVKLMEEIRAAKVEQVELITEVTP